MPPCCCSATTRSATTAVPNNPLLAESLYLARYIEKAGSGTERMIELCREAGLPEPTFELRAGSFVVTLWRDWMTEAVLAGLALNERQQRVVALVKTGGRIGNLDYQQRFAVSKPTASRDLEDMVSKGVLEKVGTTGKGTYYVISRKGLAKGSKGSGDQ